MDNSSLPVACSLTTPEFRERRSGVLRKVRDAVVEKKELADGYAYRFPSNPVWITELASLITFEHECCPFLRFSLNIEPANGPIWLELTGPDGTKNFLDSIFGEISQT